MYPKANKQHGAFRHGVIRATAQIHHGTQPSLTYKEPLHLGPSPLFTQFPLNETVAIVGQLVLHLRRQGKRWET